MLMIKNYIAQGLLVLMEKKAFPQISIKDIATKAGVNRSSYYRHFSSKEEIIRFFFSNILQEYTKVCDTAAPYKIIIHNLFDIFFKYRKELLLIYKNGIAHVMIDVLNDYFLKNFDGAAITFEERYRIHWNTGGLYNTCILWFSGEMKERPERMSEIHCDLITHPDDREFIRKSFLAK